MLLSELARRSGLPESTIRYYQRLRLVPAAGRRGRRAVYGRQHVERLAEIVRLRRDPGLSLAEIGRRAPADPGGGDRADDDPASRLAALAAPVLIARGLDGLTMDGLAAAMGVGKPTLYRHLDGRDDLLRRCLEGGHLTVPATHDDGSDCPPSAWLRQRLSAARGHAVELRGLRRLCLSLWEHPDRRLRSAARAAHAAAVAGFSRPGLLRFERAGALPGGDASRRAALLWGAALALTDAGEAGASQDDALVDPLWRLLGGHALDPLDAPAPPGPAARYGWGVR